MRTLKLIGAAAAVLVLAALGTVYGLLRASLPQLDGRVHLAGLSAPVSIARDALGVPSIEARDRVDLAYATGFVHGQDRFFQMDLARRLAAGELSELFGPVAVDQDRKTRLDARLPKLASVVYHNKLGTQGARVERQLSLPARPQSSGTALETGCGNGPPCGAPGCRRMQLSKSAGKSRSEP